MCGLNLKIDLYILLLGASGAVLLLILFIRLMTGRRNVAMNPKTCEALLAAMEPDLSLEMLTISRDKTCALGKAQSKNLLLLFRGLGNKPVLQTVTDLDQLHVREDGLHVDRQDIAHPAAHIQTHESSALEFWTQVKREGAR